MPLTIGVPKETADGETRVALVPDVVRRLTGAGLDVVVEAGAGTGAYHTDSDYEDAGATVAGRDEALGAELVAVVTPPSGEEAQEQLGEGQTLVGLLDPLGAPEAVRALAEQGVTALALELVPRISRAQKMDALSAMSSLAGYRAVLTGAHALPKFFPLLTTAAGTIRPAQVLVLGAGVAGLQALATAGRLGARAKGYDIREATREEVESLGAQFVELTLEDAEGEGEGGYAQELEQEVQERQPELLKPHVAEADVVISTALIPGRDAPILVSEEAVDLMAPGSVVVDLAAPGGGNCALTRLGETVETDGGVQVRGPKNLPAEMPVHASQLYARTLAELVEAFVDEDGEFTPDFEDDIFAGACVAHGGEVTNDRLRETLGLGKRVGARGRGSAGETVEGEAGESAAASEGAFQEEEGGEGDPENEESAPPDDDSEGADPFENEPFEEEEEQEKGDDDDEWKPPEA